MAATPENMAAGAGLSIRFARVRGFTMELTRSLQTEDFVVQSMPDVSPTKWHLAHTSWFFENFLLIPHLPGYRMFHERFGYLFNSYYYQVGKMHRRAERGLLTRPTVAEVMDYRAHVDAAMQQLLAGDVAQEILELVTLGLNHEQQHQELMLTDIKHVFSCNPLKPAFHTLPADSGSAPELTFLPGESGIRSIGFAGEGFAYDNEGPRHEVLLQPHAIANRPVTNREFREFVEDGAYQKPELWLSEGWARVLAENWQRPFYWEPDLAGEFTLGGLREINPEAPVPHISLYEADAFARWAGYRLPTEAEWECFARRYPVTGNFADSGRFHPAPPARDDEAVQVYGDVWEWTQSAYAPYPGYRPPPGAVGEYNGKFMCSQLVLRGGSCATHSTHIRPTYRNFFYPGDRWQFSGIRLAKDVT